MCTCTRRRISAISRCASFDRSCVRANELTACRMVAATTAPSSGPSRSVRCLPITSSIRYFVDAGSTRPATRLTAISTRPSAIIFRRGPTSAFRSGYRSRRRSERDFFAFSSAFALSSATAPRSLAVRQEVADRGTETVHIHQEGVVPLRGWQRLELDLAALVAQHGRDLLLLVEREQEVRRHADHQRTPGLDAGQP